MTAAIEPGGSVTIHFQPVLEFLYPRRIRQIDTVSLLGPGHSSRIAYGPCNPRLAAVPGRYLVTGQDVAVLHQLPNCNLVEAIVHPALPRTKGALFAHRVGNGQLPTRWASDSYPKKSRPVKMSMTHSGKSSMVDRQEIRACGHKESSGRGTGKLSSRAC